MKTFLCLRLTKANDAVKSVTGVVQRMKAGEVSPKSYVKPVAAALASPLLQEVDSGNIVLPYDTTCH